MQVFSLYVSFAILARGRHKQLPLEVQAWILSEDVSVLSGERCGASASEEAKSRSLDATRLYKNKSFCCFAPRAAKCAKVLEKLAS